MMMILDLYVMGSDRPGHLDNIDRNVADELGHNFYEHTTTRGDWLATKEMQKGGEEKKKRKSCSSV